MQFSALFPIFLTVFLAELGDKTQLATLAFAATGEHSLWAIFCATALLRSLHPVRWQCYWALWLDNI
jgi:putative Ca2+/H+ antiporter (TMEM165/GDT1 family)